MLTLYCFALLWTLLTALMRKNTYLLNSHTSHFMMLYLSGVLWLALLLDEVFVSGDIERVARELFLYSYISLTEAFSASSREPGFFLLQWITAQISTESLYFYAFFYLIFIVVFFMALRNIFDKWQLAFVFLTYVNLFIFHDYIEHAIRQGLAIAFLMLAIAYLKTNRIKRYYFLLGVSPLMHLSGVIGVSLALAKKIKVNALVIVWLTAVILLFLGVWEQLIPEITEPTFLNSYIEEFSSPTKIRAYEGGTHRIDFLLFSGFWILFGLLAHRYIMKDDYFYEMILKAYLSFNTVFVVLAFLAYSNRTAAYSWFLIPIIVWLPVFRMKKYQKQLSFFVLVVSFLAGLLMGSLDIFISYGWYF